MTSITTTSLTTTVSRSTDGPEQLELLPQAAVPLQFRLDEDTRRRGLRHIAEIRARLAAPHPPGRISEQRRTAA